MGKLVVIPTPIGNLEDISLRALRMLKEADMILAEDTRHVSKLLNHYNIKTSKQAYHSYNEHGAASKLAAKLKETNATYALVSDAGTPGISDPAYLIINQCLLHNIEVECLPGPTAFIPALIQSGLPSNSFCFEGFLPHQKGRVKKLKGLIDEKRTMIFYESPYRLIKTLQQFCEYFGNDRKASVSRELTKVFMETHNKTMAELLELYQNKNIKGEFVIVVDGKAD